MILAYISQLTKLKKWFSLITLSILSSKFLYSYVFWPSVDKVVEAHKCPACYGISACDSIRKVDLTPQNLFSTFSYFLGVKNVFFGSLSERKVVLKKLAHSWELEEFDNKLRDNVDRSIEKRVALDFAQDNLSRMRLCPNTQRLKNLLQRVYDNNRNVDPETLAANLWTLVVLNPEPLFLQILAAEEGWPVPEYLGACGRVVLEEYVGSPLAASYHSTWCDRARIASSLLTAAYAFTFKSDDFGFYLTDVSADNIAIDSRNVAKFVDLENVIVVDKKSSMKDKPAWKEYHESEERSIDCPNCLVYSPKDICDHKISDHNYYAICQSLLALDANDDLLPGGLLHDIPMKVSQRYPSIKYLIQQCANPVAPNTRINAGSRLKELLDTIVQELR